MTISTIIIHRDKDLVNIPDTNLYDIKNRPSKNSTLEKPYFTAGTSVRAKPNHAILSQCNE